MIKKTITILVCLFITTGVSQDSQETRVWKDKLNFRGKMYDFEAFLSGVGTIDVKIDSEKVSPPLIVSKKDTLEFAKSIMKKLLVKNVL